MPRMELVSISKSFGGLRALQGVSLSLPGGRVHGLLGENGAGKSTLMNVLYGLLRPDEGEIRRVDEATEKAAVLKLRSPADAIAAGIGMVHQHFMLAPALSVLDNILLGDRRERQWLDRRRGAERIEQLASQLNLPVDPYARVETLSVGQQQRVEILKALYREARTLILDEPTAVLTPQETDELLGALARLRERGTGVVFISHKLSEVMRICDEITVLRRGKVVWTGNRRETTADTLATQMVGDSETPLAWHGRPVRVEGGNDRPTAALPPKSILRAAHVTAAGIQDISLELGPEIFGIAGVDGNGQQELAELLVGLRFPDRGRIELNGVEITRLSARKRAEMGVGHVPNDRKQEALVASMTVVENLGLKHHRQAPFSRTGMLTRGRARPLVRRLIEQFDVRPPDAEAAVGTFSGGNQQKVVLARELGISRPKVLVAMNPTRGLDLAATAAVHRELVRQKEAGCAILLISSELEELLALSDRVGVLYRGRLTVTRFPETTQEEIGRLMAGLPNEEAPG